MAKVRAVDIIYSTSEELFALTGKRKAKRGAILKAIWAYINKNNLKAEGGGVNADDTLKAVFNKKKLKATDLMKFSDHLERVN